MIKLSLDDFISEINKLSNLDRYNMRIRVHHESVAEHSFQVPAIVLKLHDLYIFDLEKALVAGLMHDLSEADLSDIPYNIKSNNPQIEKVVDDLEQKYYINNLNNNIATSIDEFNKKSSVEGMIVALADAYCVKEFCKIEIELGTGVLGQFKLILNHTENRINQLKESLKKYERPS